MRRFEFVQGTSAKFWMADVEGKSFVVVYGRLGTAGQRKDKAFPSEAAAQKELEKKIGEKLREGYHEVSASAQAAAPAAAKGAAAAAPKIELPPRVQKVAPTAERVKRAIDALGALQRSLSGRSFLVGHRTRLARRALEGIAGIDPAEDKALAPVWNELMARVIAPKPSERLPLLRALELLYELDAAAFARAVEEIWKDVPAGSPAEKAISVLAKQLVELEDPELVLRVGALLCDRPARGGMSGESGWTLRWKRLSPHLEAYLAHKGTSLKSYLRGIDPAGDAHISRRIGRMLVT